MVRHACPQGCRHNPCQVCAGQSARSRWNTTVQACSRTALSDTSHVCRHGSCTCSCTSRPAGCRRCCRRARSGWLPPPGVHCTQQAHIWKGACCLPMNRQCKILECFASAWLAGAHLEVFGAFASSGAKPCREQHGLTAITGGWCSCGANTKCCKPSGNVNTLVTSTGPNALTWKFSSKLLYVTRDRAVSAANTSTTSLTRVVVKADDVSINSGNQYRAWRQHFRDVQDARHVKQRVQMLMSPGNCLGRILLNKSTLRCADTFTAI